jgi:hypothetical protein
LVIAGISTSGVKPLDFFQRPFRHLVNIASLLLCTRIFISRSVGYLVARVAKYGEQILWNGKIIMAGVEWYGWMDGLRAYCCRIHTKGVGWFGLVCFGTVGLGLLVVVVVVVFVGFLIDWFFTRYPLGWIDIDGSLVWLFFYSTLVYFSRSFYTTLYDIGCGGGGYGRMDVGGKKIRKG